MNDRAASHGFAAGRIENRVDIGSFAAEILPPSFAALRRNDVGTRRRLPVGAARKTFRRFSDFDFVEHLHKRIFSVARFVQDNPQFGSGAGRADVGDVDFVEELLF